MQIDPWILTFSALTVIATIWMGFWSARKSKTAHDFFVAGRSVSVGWNASAISGEYLSAASFMGVAGMVMSSGYDALWYPVCYACGYLFLLLFIAGPLRRFGAYTIPDFAEGRYDSAVFRKIAVVFVLFIGFFYTMPQMKGAGTTLAYIFKDVDLRGTWLEFLAPHSSTGEAVKGFPYWAGVLVVGAVITLNVALGGMKGITLVQAFQYWMKMFAISVPVFVLMAVYGHYGSQVGVNGPSGRAVQYATAMEASSVALTEKARAFLTQAREGRPWSSVGGSLTPDGENAYDESIGRYAILNENCETYHRYMLNQGGLTQRLRHLWNVVRKQDGYGFGVQIPSLHYGAALGVLARFKGWQVAVFEKLPHVKVNIANYGYRRDYINGMLHQLETNGVSIVRIRGNRYLAYPTASHVDYEPVIDYLSRGVVRRSLSDKAPADASWLNPFGPLTTKAAKAAAPTIKFDGTLEREDVDFGGTPWLVRVKNIFRQDDGTFALAVGGTRTAWDLVKTYADTQLLTERFNFRDRISYVRSEKLKEIRLRTNVRKDVPSVVAPQLLKILSDGGVTVVREPGNVFKAFPTKEAVITPVDPKPFALLYTYSLIIALVCGTAGLPHILVRFYTNPDGVAAKRTTMWVMILIGVFYLFPPIFGVMGRNLAPELYTGTGSKGTDKVVLELPRILNNGRAGVSPSQITDEQKSSDGNMPSLPPQSQIANRKSQIPWGSILSGITCAGAFAAFMSTFSGLLVSMTGALAHDVYGRMLRPKSTPQQRMRAFRVAAVVLGGSAIVAGTFVEPFQINFMVGQAFAIAAASYFPLLFMSAWWRGMTTKGATIGMLAGGMSAVLAISLTSFSDLKWLRLDEFWAAHPLLRILCEQPALWAVPLAIALMVVVSKLTRKQVPPDVRMKMLVLHAPETLGLKQEYIQEHQAH